MVRTISVAVEPSRASAGGGVVTIQQFSASNWRQTHDASAGSPPRQPSVAASRCSAAFPGGYVDCSVFIAAHANDVTPTSIGIPALRERPARPVDERFSELFERVWLAAGGLTVGDQRVAMVERDGAQLPVPLDELTVIEAAQILYPHGGPP